jgi:hypothetical protein
VNVQYRRKERTVKRIRRINGIINGIIGRNIIWRKTGKEECIFF